MSEENQESLSGDISEAAAQPASEAVEQASPHPEGEKEGLLSALQAERQQRQHLQEQIQMLNHQVSSLRYQSEAPKKKDPLDGVEDDEILTVGMGKNYTSQLMKQFKDEVEELKTSLKHPDYADTVKKYLPKVLEKAPGMTDAIRNSPNPYETAYYLATHSEDYLKDKAIEKSPQAQKVLDQQMKAGNLSSAGTSAPKGQVSGYSHLSDKEFKQLMNKNLGYF